jgi:predicted transcriptional regulator
MGKDLYREAMDGIFQEVALKAIRKVIRGKEPEKEKLAKIVTIIHSYEDDVEQAELAAERRAIQEEEEQDRKERIADMFDGMKAPLDELEKCIKKGDGK